MTTSERRTCNGCGTAVSHMTIDDAHCIEVITEFVFMKNGLAVTGDNCPGCDAALTLESTTAVARPVHK